MRPVHWRPKLLAVLLVAFTAFPSVRAAAQTATDKPDWSTLRAAYSYDAAKPPIVKEEALNDPKFLSWHLTFIGTEGETVVGVFIRPKAAGIYPCALLLHGFGSDKEVMLKAFGRPLATKGFAILALDAPRHGERKAAGQTEAPRAESGRIIRQGVIEYRQALDYVMTRKDVDSKHIGLLGYSMGSMMGMILGGVDERIRAFVFCVGGDPIAPAIQKVPPAIRNAMLPSCPSLFVAHIAPRPILMLNGKLDKVMSEAATKLVYDAAKEPKQIIWYKSGHILPLDAALKSIEWLPEKIKSK